MDYVEKPTDLGNQLDHRNGMPQFFFKFRTGDQIDADPDGQKLPDLDAAVRQALQGAREIVADAIKSGREDGPDDILIFDEQKICVSTVSLSSVVPRRLRR